MWRSVCQAAQGAPIWRMSGLMSRERRLSASSGVPIWEAKTQAVSVRSRTVSKWAVSFAARGRERDFAAAVLGLGWLDALGVELGVGPCSRLLYRATSGITFENRMGLVVVAKLDGPWGQSD